MGRSANVMLYIIAEVKELPAFIVLNETDANILKVPDIPERIKENPALSHDKAGFINHRKEKINRFSHGLTYVHPLPGNNIYRPT